MYSRMAKSLRKYMWKTVGQKDPLKKDTHFCARPVNKTDQKLCVKGVNEKKDLKDNNQHV